ncbi:MAG: NAD(P)-binding domain-containing protein, partial [Ignavibacteriae bacterium]|nr:NAD(P)-binding domain-containing protein [Ignavibacteriota bacterium]
MRLGLIGTGLMGKPMAEKLIEAKYDLKIYNRTAGKTENLINIGAKGFTDVNELANNSDVIIIMLSNYDAIEEVLFESNISQLENKTIIQM